MTGRASAGPERAPGRILVANGPGANVDPSAFERFCAGWAEPFGIELATRACVSVSDLAEAVRSAAGYDGVILNVDGCESVIEVEAELASSGIPAASVTLETTSPAAVRVGGCSAHIHGRGVDGYRWALQHLVYRAAWPAETIAYGDRDEQVGDLRLPRSPGPLPVVVLVHGGGWKERWQRDIMEGPAVDLCRRGLATWNVEFRRVGSVDGGWPGTFADVANAVDAVAELARDYPLDLSRVVVLGHSSGGQLAVWAASNAVTRADARVSPALVVSLAGVLDLHESARRGLIGGENAAVALLGGLPADVPDRYAEASPLRRLPIGIPQILVQGLRDYIPDLVDFNRAYAARAHELGDDVELLEVPDADHLGVVDARSAAWARVAETLEARVASGRASRG